MNVVLFELANGLYALPGEMVLEVIPNLPATPLPFAPIGVDGLINHAGQVLMRIDLAVQLGLADRPMEQEGILLVVRIGAVPCALHIHRVMALVPVEDANLHWCETREKADQEDGSLMVMGEFDWQDKTVLLLDASRLGPDDLDTSLPPSQNRSDGLLGRMDERGTQTQSDEESCLHCLVVETLGARYALRLEEVREVVEVSSLTPIPHAPPEVAGVIFLRHQPYLTLTLSGLLDSREREESAVMILVGHHGVHLGLLVKRVVGIDRFYCKDRHPTDGQSAYHAFLQDRQGRMIAQINLDGLIDADRFERYRPFMTSEHLPGGQHEKCGDTQAFLSVRVGEEWCAVPLATVDRVVAYEPPDPLTREIAKEDGMRQKRVEMDGVAQIHGEITPVSDLRHWFGSSLTDTAQTAYVVVRVAEQPWALAVDQVNRVVNIPERAIELLTDQRHGWVTAVGQLDGCLFSVLNVDVIAGRETIGG